MHTKGDPQKNAPEAIALGKREAYIIRGQESQSENLDHQNRHKRKEKEAVPG
jgi:hypothetical protein